MTIFRVLAGEKHFSFEHGLKWARPDTKLYPRGPGTLSGQTVQPFRAGAIAPLGRKILPKQTAI